MTYKGWYAIKPKQPNQSLFHFETGTTTTVFDLPDNLYG